MSSHLKASSAHKKCNSSAE